jgi:hypothetical protein
MIKGLRIVFIAALAGCSGIPQREYAASPCFADEASYECQIERYHNVNE